MAKRKYKISVWRDFESLYYAMPSRDHPAFAASLTKEQIRIQDKSGWTIAHHLASLGLLPEKYLTDDILLMRDDGGTTVVHAFGRHLPEQLKTEKYLNLSNFTGYSVYHVLARSNSIPDRFLTRENLCRIADDKGETLAHSLAYFGFLPEEFLHDDEILWMRNEFGTTVLHRLASLGKIPDRMMTEEILLTENTFGETPANILADAGRLPEKMMTERVLSHKDKDGTAIIHTLIGRQLRVPVPEHVFTKELLAIEDKSGVTAAERFVAEATYRNEWSTIYGVFLDPSAAWGRKVSSHIIGALAKETQELLEEHLKHIPSASLELLARSTGSDRLRKEMYAEITRRTEAIIFENTEELFVPGDDAGNDLYLPETR